MARRTRSLVLSLIAMVGATGLSACTGTREASLAASQSHSVAISRITGAMKCAFARALISEAAQNGDRLRGRVAKVVYVFKIIAGSAVKGGVETSMPAIFTLGSAPASFGFKLGGSITRTDTITTKITARLGLLAANDRVCDNVPTGDIYAFQPWLDGVIQALDANKNFEPKGIVDKIQYAGDFAVTVAGNGSGTLDIAFFSANAGADNSRQDIQQIFIDIEAPSKDLPYPQPGPGTGVGSLKTGDVPTVGIMSIPVVPPLVGKEDGAGRFNVPYVFE